MELSVLSWFGLIAGAALAGFIDSVAGGGGLITLPLLALVLGPGTEAIGTNKILGSFAAFVALTVYARRGHVVWRPMIAFAFWVGVGSVLGSRLVLYLPPAFFPVLLWITCPLILLLLWRRDLWIQKHPEILGQKPSRRNRVVLYSCGVACGIYDGAWGPGGGTFMFLTLLFVGKFPLLTAMAGTKVVNIASAGTALVSYALAGLVHWKLGCLMALGIGAGAWFGAHYATRKAVTIVRPLLAVVTTLLLIRLCFS